MESHKCLKEWNAIIEALGHGKQTILIRNSKTNITEFLLYPTVSYTFKDDYLNSFQVKHQKFSKENSLPYKKGDKVLIKYFATLEKIIEKPISKLPSDKYYIWTKDHVNNFITGETAFVWVLSVYILNEPYLAEPTPGAIRFANLMEEVSLDGMKPVLNDSDFFNILDNLK